MKTLNQTLIVAILLALTLGAVTGCSKDKNNDAPANVRCDQFGCYPSNPGYDPYNPYAYNPNAIIAGGNTNVIFNNGWLDTLEVMGFCGTRNLCGYIDSMPFVQIVFNDYKFTNGTSTGIVSIGNSQVPMRSFTVHWRKIDNNTAIDAQFSINNGFKNRVMRVKLMGREVGGTTVSTTVSQMPIELYIDGVVFSEGDIYRVNRP